jgi:hypothetical protein
MQNGSLAIFRVSGEMEITSASFAEAGRVRIYIHDTADGSFKDGDITIVLNIDQSDRVRRAVDAFNRAMKLEVVSGAD